MLDHADEAPLADIKMERQREERSETQYATMVTKLLCSYCGAHGFVEYIYD